MFRATSANFNRCKLQNCLQLLDLCAKEVTVITLEINRTDQPFKSSPSFSPIIARTPLNRRQSNKVSIRVNTHPNRHSFRHPLISRPDRRMRIKILRLWGCNRVKNLELRQGKAKTRKVKVELRKAKEQLEVFDIQYLDCYLWHRIEIDKIC